MMFAPAKINLGLKITGRYENGYHKLESLFIPITVFDRLWLQKASVDTVFHAWPAGTTGAELRLLAHGAYKNPLLLKTIAIARRFLAQNHGITLRPIAVRVEKKIPSPAGLGGASSDAAALLWQLLQAYTAEIPGTLLQESEQLGADVPFFLRYGLRGRAAYLSGVGHELTGVDFPQLCGYVCVPGFGFSTPKMFAEVARWDLPRIGRDAAAKQPSSQSNLALRLNEIPYSDEPISGVRVVQNDFDAAAESVFPDESRRLIRAKKTIAQAVAQFFPGEWVIGMTGSGAGLFSATEMDIPMPRLRSLQTALKARLGRGWRVMPFRSIGP